MSAVLPPVSFARYYGPHASLNGLQVDTPVTPEELEFFAEQELIDIVPNFSIEGSGTLFCIGGTYGPFQPNVPTRVPLWLAVALHKRKKCRIMAPEWMDPDTLKMSLDEERTKEQSFQPLPTYYMEVARCLFRNRPAEIFESEERFATVRSLIESLRNVRYHKIEAGLKGIKDATSIRLTNLAAGEVNMVRTLLKGTMDHFYELAKNNRAFMEQSLTNPQLYGTPASGQLTEPF